MNTTLIVRKSLLAFSALLLSTALWAHGGAQGTDTDQCKFELEPSHWIHYTAYQPKTFPQEEFCATIPNANEPIILVFDYQDQRYKDNTVEFEVTKEPEGKRVFFLEGAKHKKGTVELKLNDGVPEAGNYLIHITLVPDQGERKDVHMAFKAGGGASTQGSILFLYFLIGLTGLYVLYMYFPPFKNTLDKIMGKVKE